MLCTTLVPFPGIGRKVFAAKRARIYITSIRTSVRTITQCGNGNNNIIDVNYRLKMSLWFEVKKEITNQISKFYQIPCSHSQFNSNQITNQITTFWFVSNIWITPDLNTTLIYRLLASWHKSWGLSSFCLLLALIPSVSSIVLFWQNFPAGDMQMVKKYGKISGWVTQWANSVSFKPIIFYGTTVSSAIDILRVHNAWFPLNVFSDRRKSELFARANAVAFCRFP